ncbi:MAG: cytochrome D ubiquinol oxidase subunit II, partial [Verrucomicrobiota bacterium]|nr:cytochrome D ubiquinol oxidase subunit II [Verrucomicrobiota bacterium]
FHSYRYVGDKIVLRLNAVLAEDSLATIEEEFSDLVKAGRMIQQNALEEDDEEELSGLARLVFRHRRRDFGRLRQLIDAVNASEIAAEK